jgi:hypothetical protein
VTNGISHKRSGGVIQTKRYKTTADKNKLRLSGSVDVDENEANIDVTGKLTSEANKDLPVSESVNISAYKVSKDRSQEPVRASDRLEITNFFEPPNALRVANLSARPRGIRLGQLLMYHHALMAQNQEKPYIIAVNVSDARGPVYEPLGFTDYNKSRPWNDLNAKKQSYDDRLRSEEGKQLSQKEVDAILEARQALVDELSRSSMIIDTNLLINNSRRSWELVWTEQKD